MIVGIGCDHGGLDLKQVVLDTIKELQIESRDFGTFTSDSVDYPDFARPVAMAVKERAVQLGILICGTGIGISIAANKVPGIRAALCADTFSAKMARAHNDANVLCLGARTLGPGLAQEIVRAFLAGKFEGGRHAARVAKIHAIETECSAASQG